MTRLLFFAILFLASIPSNSQQKEVLGRLIDIESQKPILGVRVMIEGADSETTSNQLGYFKISIPSEESVLIFSHISYQTIRIKSPNGTGILLKMTKQFYELPSLDLEYFNLNKPLIVDDTTSSISQSRERNANYPGGLQFFYNEIYRLLRADSLVLRTKKTLVVVRFSVGTDGATNFLPDTSSNQTVYQSLKLHETNFLKWNSALQNDVQVVQFFELPVLPRGEVYTVIDETAVPQGGFPALYNFFSKQMKYPKEAKRKGVKGKVFVQFTIDHDGSI